jgi:hypothetical protein
MQKEVDIMAGSSVNHWVETFRNLSDHDEELQAHGKFFTCSYKLDAAEHCYIVSMNEGKVTDIAVDPGLLDKRYQFAICASADTWRKFSQPTPSPMYHGIWAATFRRDMRLEGDLLVMMQNLRCLTRQLELLRETGSPV